MFYLNALVTVFLTFCAVVATGLSLASGFTENWRPASICAIVALLLWFAVLKLTGLDQKLIHFARQTKKAIGEAISEIFGKT